MPKNRTARTHPKLNKITSLTNIVSCIDTEAWDSVIQNCYVYKKEYSTADNNPQLHGVLSEIECAIHNFEEEIETLKNRIFDCVGV